jgi:hypothetical protein
MGGPRRVSTLSSTSRAVLLVAAVGCQPAPVPAAQPLARGERLVVALAQWGIETPFAW